ncbi:TadE/TadG family type IV pilus assembly protein [Streptomyces sp. CBMA291]|uniref:TadE/TadG family type IV pilus assembly protein n=1 Tax=unclassified Streptomyces TaxID=2593676 RepID=UPI001E006E7D|nr:hypothetical protein [Streptomyces sp. CBMA291]MBD0713478.1 hypothetical protein [Streptomyces sp. CBMA370]
MEYLGFLPVLLLVGLAGLQLGVAAYAAQQAGAAARAAARAVSVKGEGEGGPDAGAAAHAAADRVSGVKVVPGADDVTVTVWVKVPQVVPFWTFDPVKRTATMPLTDEEDRP